MATLIALSVLITSPSSALVALVESTVTVVASIASADRSSADRGRAPTCAFNFDGGGANQVVAAERGSCTATNTFTAPGVFTVAVTATQRARGIDTDTVVIFVVDPAAQVIGRGRLGNRARFNVAPGRLTLVAPGFRFASTALDVLVVTGNKGQLRGSGTVNGAGNFGFILTVADGTLPGGDGVDRFRLKVVDRSAGDAVVYDDVPGAPDDIDIADPQAIPAGRILVHKDK